jgi:hypothetical protein
MRRRNELGFERECSDERWRRRGAGCLEWRLIQDPWVLGISDQASFLTPVLLLTRGKMESLC